MPAAIHYLSSNDSTWTPPAVLTLDTETRVIQDYPEVQQLRCWHVRGDTRPLATQLTGDHAEGSGTTAEDLAERITKWTRRRAQVWLYAHNLGFDMAVTRLPLLLAGHGWQMTDMAMDGTSPWMILEDGPRKLVIADSYAIWPVKLGEIGEALGVPKLPDPEPDDERGWMDRCAGDTRILHTALLTAMDYHDAQQLGRWAITGASIGWNTMRHLQPAKTGKRARKARVTVGLPAVDPVAQPVVIDPDPDGRAHDRQAIYGGRRQTMRHGHLPRGQYAEIDFERAYQTIMATMALPRKRGRWFDSMDVDARIIDDPCHQWGIIANVLIKTDVPRWPCRLEVSSQPLEPGTRADITGMPADSKTRVFYPTGEFWTTLAGPDIAEARRLGCLKAVGRGQVHQLGWAIRPWATWSLAAQDHPDTPAVVRLALKHQGRAVAGKWAQRSWSKEVIGASTTYGWTYSDAWNAATGTRAAIIDMAGTKFLATPSDDADNAYPAVLAWIESYTRVLLGRAIDALGEGGVVQCDTDGLIADMVTVAARENGPRPKPIAGDVERDPAEAVLTAVNERTVPLRLRRKTLYRTVEIIGPQHLTLDGQRRWSGVPGSAERQPDGSYSAMTWPKLAWQMNHGDRRGYTRVAQTYRLAKSYAPGWLLKDGRVVAVETHVDDDNRTRITRYSETRYAQRGDKLAPHQPATLEGYR